MVTVGLHLVACGDQLWEKSTSKLRCQNPELPEGRRGGAGPRPPYFGFLTPCSHSGSPPWLPPPSGLVCLPQLPAPVCRTGFPWTYKCLCFLSASMTFRRGLTLQLQTLAGSVTGAHGVGVLLLVPHSFLWFSLVCSRFAEHLHPLLAAFSWLGLQSAASLLLPGNAAGGGVPATLSLTLQTRGPAVQLASVCPPLVGPRDLHRCFYVALPLSLRGLSDPRALRSQNEAGDHSENENVLSLGSLAVKLSPRQTVW